MTADNMGLNSILGMSVRDVIDARARDLGAVPFLLDPNTDQTISYAQLKKACVGFSHNLAQKGFRPGERVGYAMTNSPLTALTILGALYGGYLVTAVNLVSGKSTIAHVLKHSGARAVFVESKTVSLIEEVIEEQGDLPLELFEMSHDWLQSETIVELEKPSDATDGLLMYTSGTTGVPKGVVLTHAALLAGGHNVSFAHKLTNEDRALCVLPLYHINGLCVTIMGPLVSGSAVIVPEKFSVSAFWHQMRSHQCTWFSVVPTHISYLLQEAETSGHDQAGLEGVRFGRSASAPLSPEVQTAFETRFQIPIVETMGLTETAAQILSNPLPPGTRKIGSPGIAVGNEVMIGDDQQREVPRGEEGEVLVRGLNVMRCYRNNEEATRVALTKDGWLRTGDLGRMDADGYVFITGRLKELIIKGGENIAPREIDEALYRHPDVIEAAAFARSCTRYGQKVEAGVMVRQGSNLNEAILIRQCEEVVGPFKSPARIYFLAELPKGPSGKIQRRKLAEMTQEDEATFA